MKEARDAERTSYKSKGANQNQTWGFMHVSEEYLFHKEENVYATRHK